MPSKVADELTTVVYDPATLQFLTKDYVTHLKHHLSKIEERTNGFHNMQ